MDAPSKLTKEQWDACATALTSPYGHVEMLIDGYKIDLQVLREKGLRFTIVVFVNGSWTGKMLSEDCDERRRFMCPKTKATYTAAEKAKWLKVMGRSKKELARVNAKFSYWLPCWPSFTPLRRHLAANNTSIEILKAFP